MHHIVADEWSLKVLFHEVGSSYMAQLERRDDTLSPLPIQYADFTRWQRERISAEAGRRQMDYWRVRLGSAGPVTELSVGQRHHGGTAFIGAQVTRELGMELAMAVRAWALQEEVTLFMVLLSAFKALIFRYTRQEDVVVGSPFAGRTRLETESLIGFFVNTLPLRTRVMGEMSGRDLLAAVRETALGAQANQDLPFEKLVEELQPERAPGHLPFTRLMFVVQNGLLESLDWPGLTIDITEAHTGTSKFDLTLVLQETSRGLVAKVEYDVDLFAAATIERLLGHYESLLRGMLNSPDKPIALLPVLKGTEWTELRAWGCSCSDYRRNKTLHEVFEAQAHAWPDRIAISYGTQCLTYGELNARANQLAASLRQSGVGPDVPVVVCIRRSPELVVALLGVLKAGGAYAPADPGYPKERLSFMIEDTRAPVLLTEQALLSRIPSGNAKVLCLDADWELIARESRENLPVNVQAGNLAYIMFTSGSTGVPKGAAIPHRAVNRLVLNPDWIQLGAGSRVAQVANASFDAATFEIWGALLNGGHLVGITQAVALSPRDFARELREQQITAMFLTAALFNQVAAEVPGAFETLDTLIAGGEALDPKWVRSVLKNRPPRRLLNGYGPTENTTFTCCHLIQSCSEHASNVPIGRPISNTSVYVLDERMQPVPIGVPGQLYAGGDGLATGYWNRPELTFEKFVPNPFGDPAGQLYRTGDLARWLPDGTIEFLGRIDDQVKIRGFRVELGEIETVLGRHPGVRECVVNVCGDTAGTKRLVAYFVPERGCAPKANEMRAFLMQHLPEHMLPSAYVRLESLPLTSNGKVDRRALPEPDEVRPDLERKFVRPGDAVEAQLAEIWEGVLKVRPIGIEDKFFELGGHSLLAVQVISRIEKGFGRKLRLATIFQTPTIRQLAAIIRGETQESSGSRSTSIVAIQPDGRRPPLFLVHGAGGGMFWGYVNLARYLGGDQPVYGFKSRGLDGQEEFASIPEMAAHYIAELHAVQPQGPYYLGGYCFGGNVAFEMARQLEARGDKVAVVALLNCAPPNSRYMRISWSLLWAGRLALNLVYWARYFVSWSSSQRREFFRWKLGRIARRLRSHGRGVEAGRGQLEAANLVDLSAYSEEQRKVWEAHIHALVHFHPRPFSGPVHLFRSSGHPLWCSFDPDYGWSDYAHGGVKITVVPGAHEKILDEPCVAGLAVELKKVLEFAPSSINGAGGEKQEHMDVFRGLLVNTALFWLGANGDLLTADGLGHGTTSLAMLLHQVSSLRKSPGAGEPQIEGVSGDPDEPAGTRKPVGEPARLQTETMVLDPQVTMEFHEVAKRLGVPPPALMLTVAKALLVRYAPEQELTRELLPVPINPVSGSVVCSIHRYVISREASAKTRFDELACDLHREPLCALKEPVVVAFEILISRPGETPAETSASVALRLTLDSNPGCLEGRVDFNPELFTLPSVQRLLGHWRGLLAGAVRQPELPIGMLPLVSAGERERILKQWNGTSHPFPLTETYVVQFAAQARRSPQGPAVIWQGGEWTFQQLDARASQLGRRLSEVGAGPESLVAICLERSPDLMASFLAVWKNGAAYVPLDPSYPKERLAFMLKDSQARVIITQRRFLNHLPAGEREVICLDDPLQQVKIAACDTTGLILRGTPDNAAYVIYTSGSTGTPKGVVITQRSLLNHGHACGLVYKLQPRDRVLQFAAISFDISVEEIFPTWLAGGCVLLRTDSAISSIPQFVEFIRRHGITVLNLPTAYWHELVNGLAGLSLPPTLRLVVIGGEKASDEVFRRWNQIVSGSVQLINTYGPTETTVTATAQVAEPGMERLSIGRALPNTQALILDANLQLVPIGVAGELCLGGMGLARGYLGRPKLTAEKFVPNPFPGELATDRIYRTGDLARFLEDGTIEFIGRRDEQVKIRGFRIELGEIEAVLRAHPGIADAAVIAREDIPGRKVLAAYYVVRSGAVLTHKQVAAFVKTKLPAYMVPTAFTALAEFPKTPAGKIDRRSLPAPDAGRPQVDVEFVPPSTAVEKALGQIWSEVLGADQVGVADNFFELGGDSLLATRMLSRIHDSMRAEVTMAELFANPDIASLAKHLVEQGQRLSLEAGLMGAALGSAVPLTASQRRIWFLDNFDPDQSAFNLPLGLRLTGPIQVEALERSIRVLVERHEVLRSVFPEAGGDPVRLVCQPSSVRLETRDLAETGDGQAMAQAMLLAAQEANRSYMHSRPMLRAILIRLAPEDHLLVLVTHAIASDMESLRLLLEELTAVYEAQIANHPNPLPPLKSGYTEVMAADCLPPGEERAARDFWRSELAGVPDLLELPADHPRPGFRNDDGARHPLRLPPDLWGRLLGIAREHDCDVFTVLLAAFSAVLHRYSASADIVVGTSISTRQRRGADRIFGGFENDLAIRCTFEGNPSFRELLGRLKDRWTNARLHGSLPFDDVLEEVQPPRDASHTPIYQVKLGFDEKPLPEIRAGNVTFTPFSIENHTAKLDLHMHITSLHDGAEGWIDYSTQLFEPDRVARLAEHLQTLLAAALANPDTAVAELSLLPEAEAKVLEEWTDTRKPYLAHHSLYDLFAEQAARVPQAEALVDGHERLTYGALLSASAAVAKELGALGVGSGHLVGVCLGRSWEMVAALLGVFRAGAAYVPLDPAYPPGRLEFMLKDSGCRVLLTERKHAGTLPAGQAQTLCMEDIHPLCVPAECPGENLPQTGRNRGLELASVIYTSGSTGIPKGVALNHQGAVALVAWAKDVFSADELSGVLASTSICFDLSVFELFIPLCLGGRVILAENALGLAGLPAAGEVRLVNTVPSAIRELLAAHAVPDTVLTVNLAGEPLSSSLVDQIYAQTSVRNVYDLYGPTETTTYSTFALRQPGEAPTIGKPLPNETVFILDRRLQPVPIGIPGELCIGGDGLARGYLGRPDLTAERFIAHPAQAGVRLYRTGDLARWRRDGKLEYLVRLDHQVKIRGFRIELGEIEEVLKKQPEVSAAVVIAREDQPGEKRLVAYVAARVEPVALTRALRAAVVSRLPAHMVPAHFVVLEQLPLTPNGKLDRKALPRPEPIVPGNGPEPPGNPLEEQLAEIWRSALGLSQPPGVWDDFFEMGGHSLLAMRFCSRVREELKIELPIRALFQAPNIRSLAVGVAQQRWGRSPTGPPLLKRTPRDANLTVSFVQERLWFLDQIDPGGHAYNVPWAVRLQGLLDRKALQYALDQAIVRHETLRTSFSYEDGNLRQVVHDRAALTIESEDLSGEADQHREARAAALMRAEAQRPFDLARAPLLRAKILRLGETEHLLLVVMHHAISDGWSLTLLGRELVSFYNAFTTGSATPALPDLPLQYADFSHWQREWMQGAVLEQELAYWKASLAGAPTALDLPTDHQPGNLGNGGDTREVFLSGDTLGRLAGLSHREAATPFIMLMTALAITLRQWSGQEDIVIGTVVAGRNRREIEQLIGCFMNFLPIRVRLHGAATAHQALRQVRKTVLDGQAHQDCPFERLVEAMNPERRQNENPLYNVAFLFQSFPPSVFDGQGLKASPCFVSTGAALLDLRFEAEPREDGLAVICEYKTGLFDPGTIDQLLRSLCQVLEMLLQDLHAPLTAFKVTPELAAQAGAARERNRLEVINVTATFTAEPLEEPLRHWMRELETPAVLHFAPYNQVFQQLLDPSSLLRGSRGGLNLLLIRLEDWQPSGPGESSLDARAAVERARGEFVQAMQAAVAESTTPHLVCFCPPSTKVASQAETLEFLAGIEERLAVDLELLGGVYVLRSGQILGWYPVADYYDASGEALGSVPYTTLFFTALATAVARRYQALERAAAKVIVLDCDNTLWSGVCGEEGPQGIRLDAPWKALQEFMLAQHSSGMLLCLCSKNNEEDVEAVFAQRPDMPLRRQHFTAVKLNWLPKSDNLKALASELNLGLDSFIFLDDNPVECAEVEANCPEVLTLQLPDHPGQLETFLRHCWIFDHLKVTAEDRNRAQMYHQNAQRESLRSETMSLGDFFNSLDLRIHIEPMTEAQVTRAAQLIQRTNQFNLTTRRRTEGELRASRQTHEVVTVSVSDRFGDYGLVGLIIFSAHDLALKVDTFLLSCRVLGRGVEHRVLNRLGHLARERRLKTVEVPFIQSAKNQPAYNFLQSAGKDYERSVAEGSVFLFPAGYAADLALDTPPRPEASVPVSQPGSVAPAAPAPAKKFARCRSIALELNEAQRIHEHFEARTATRVSRRKDYAAPHTGMERTLCQLWRTLLRVDRIGTRDNFFDLGGHSLLAVRLFAEIEKMTGRKFPLVTLFQAPTVEQLARVLCQNKTSAAHNLLVPIQPKGTKPPLFLVHGAGGDVLWGYANLATHLGLDQPIYGIKSRGQTGQEEFSDLTQMAEFYVGALLDFQLEGPYYLGGYCFGGNVAYEMARLLRERGRDVGMVALIDSSPSNTGYEKLAWWRPYRFAKNLFYWMQDFAALKWGDRRNFFLRKGRALLRKIRQRCTSRGSGEPVDLEEVIDLAYFPENELKLWQCHLNALVQHVEKPYDGPVTLLRTRGQPVFCSFEDDFGWRRLVSGAVSVHVIPGSHENIFIDPHVQVLAHTLVACLEEVRAGAAAIPSDRSHPAPV